MKKLFLMSAAALTVFAACTKNEVVNIPDSKISFNSPVVAAATKANVKNQEIGTTYDINENFIVSAWSYENTAGNAWAGVTEENLYMDKVTCSYSTNDNGWVPVGRTYYWPKDYYLAFAAVSPVDVEDLVSYSNDGLTITNFTTPDAGQMYDLMYSDITNKINANNSSNKYDGVDTKFNHALSSIVVSVKYAEEYNTDDDEVIEVTDIKFTGVKDKATFKQNYGSTPAWTIANGANDVEYSPLSDEQLAAINANAKTVQTNALLLIPQSLNNIKLEVTYTIKGETELENNFEIGLDGEYKNGEDKVTVNNWEPGKRYVYNIVIGLDKIQFAPSVNNWVEYSKDIAVQ